LLFQFIFPCKTGDDEPLPDFDFESTKTELQEANQELQEYVKDFGHLFNCEEGLLTPLFLVEFQNRVFLSAKAF
jgi:hypothetical protein